MGILPAAAQLQDGFKAPVWVNEANQENVISDLYY